MAGQHFQERKRGGDVAAGTCAEVEEEKKNLYRAGDDNKIVNKSMIVPLEGRQNALHLDNCNSCPWCKLL